jgi:DNA mismatch repair protein MutS2
MESDLSQRPDSAPLHPIDANALHALGWPQLIAALEARARTPMGRERCASLLPGADAAEMSLRLARVEEARLLKRLDKEVPLADALEVRPALARAAKEGALEPGELLQIARLIRAAAGARRFIYGQADRAPLHFAWAETLTDLTPLAEELERAFDSGGKLLDGASALLAELRARSRGLHRSIKARLDTMLEEPELIDMLRDTYYSVRGDRYVLPVRAEHKTHLPGIVHNASGSGQTLFVEPQELVELGNQLTIAEASILEEEQRILAELSGAAGRRADELSRDVDTLGRLDEVAAGARLADELDANPFVVPLDGAFKLERLRHPLLVLQQKARALTEPARVKNVIANDVELRGTARALIVSGPNAGGKTVTITAVGISALMARAGLPIPAAAGSAMPLYAQVLTAIGDEGDMSRDLSTFTAHLAALKSILERAAPGVLVLIDEMAADTDPREGAAIAVAALEQLVEAGAQVLITTHLEELKALGLTDPRFASASVGFDVNKLAPTYQLALGAAGASSAIEIARRVGMPESLCLRARAILGGGSSAIATALEKLEREQSDLMAARKAADEARIELEKERVLFERERRALKALERATREGARDLLIEDLEQRRQEAAKLIAELQAGFGQGGPTMAQAVRAEQALKQMDKDERARGEKARSEAEVIAEQDAEFSGAPAKHLEKIVEEKLAPGMAVKHARLGSEGQIVEMLGAQALVQMGALRIKVDLDELIPLHRKARSHDAQFKKSAAEKLQRGADAKPQAVTVAPTLVDVRGQRVDEAIRQLEEALDKNIQRGVEELQVWHGHGSGALKAAIREHLARSPYVRRARPALPHEGGDQVTIVELKG